MKIYGAVAAGHQATADAAANILREGGNAFDAIIAAHWCACIAEPVLTSLGGGGFLLARPAGQSPQVYDFFTQTPLTRLPCGEVDFTPIHADFGTTRQEFHIGYGSVATPGTVRGLFSIQRELATLPMPVLVEPAIALARQGVRINQLQAYIINVVKPICLHTRATRQNFASDEHPERIVAEGETLRFPQLADSIEALSREGDRLFYQGEIASQIEAACTSSGGHLRKADLQQYQLIHRQPLRIPYRGLELFCNPPPSSGGILLGFALAMLERLAPGSCRIDTTEGLTLLANVMQQTNEFRLHADFETLNREDFDHELLDQYAALVRRRKNAFHGTTHISVIDRYGNVASLTSSNGEGCGHMLGDTGIMLNNMLGEEDLNPDGFHQWQENRRLTSMMTPGMLYGGEDTCIAFGSGGSNRIRSAILQVLLRLIDEDLGLEEAIRQPRIHYEKDLLNMEAGFADNIYRELGTRFPQHKCWPDHNLYFGGVHAVKKTGSEFDASGDPRRGGVSITVA